MRITEIDKIHSRDFDGYDAISFPDSQKDRLQPLPGRSGYFYYLNNAQFQSIINLISPDKKKIVATLKLDPYNFPIPNTVQVDSISVDPRHRGQGLGLALYGIVLTIMRRTLVSGDQQTPDGRRMWTVLYDLQRKIPNLSVRGYFTIADYDFDDEKDIPIILGQLGAEYLGTIKNFHMFAFDVNPNTTGKELEANIKTKFSKIYNNDYDIINSVGLFAQVRNRLDEKKKRRRRTPQAFSGGWPYYYGGFAGSGDAGSDGGGGEG
jgi:GNAT superfamily N-acetyltransferase